MSSEIYYDKAFISIGDKYIPLVCHGSNNTYEFNRNGREVAERYWAVLNRPYRGRSLFTSEEIQKIAETYEGFSQDNLLSLLTYIRGKRRMFLLRIAFWQNYLVSESKMLTSGLTPAAAFIIRRVSASNQSLIR